MNAIQCFDGLGGPVIFRLEAPASDLRAHLDRVKHFNSYVGRAAKLVATALDTASELNGKDVQDHSILFRDKLVDIRAGLEPIDLATRDYPNTDLIEHLTDQRRYVDMLLTLFGVSAETALAEATRSLERPDALDGVVAKTIGSKLVNLAYWEGHLIATLHRVRGEDQRDLSSIMKPHRLKNIIFDTYTRKVHVHKSVLWFVWGDEYEMTMCMDFDSVRVWTNKGLQQMRIKPGRYSEKESRNLTMSLQQAEKALNHADLVEAVEHRHG